MLPSALFYSWEISENILKRKRRNIDPYWKNEWTESRLNTILNRVTNKIVQLRRDRKTEALKCWEPIVNGILEYVQTKDRRFRALHIFPTGSYYERAKVKEPDEFDLMLVMDNLELDDAPFEEDDGFREPPIGKIRPV